jgi:hypothetical protein
VDENPGLLVTFDVELTDDQIREIATSPPERLELAGSILKPLCDEWVASNGPAGIRAVLDCDGAVWHLIPSGNWLRHPSGPSTTWRALLEGHGPLTPMTAGPAIGADT